MSNFVAMPDYSVRLIRLVRENRILYDTTSNGYQDKPLHSKTWNMIGEKLGTPGLRCKQQWRHMRDTFRKILRRRKYPFNGEVPSNKDAADDRKPYRYEKEMQFLVPYMRLGKEDSILLAKQFKEDNFNELMSNSNNSDSNTQRSCESADFDDNSTNPEISDRLEDDKSQILKKIENLGQPVEQNESRHDPTTATSEDPLIDDNLSEFGADEVDYSYIIQEFNQTNNNNTSQKSSHSRKPPDEIDTFFCSMAQTVKRLNPYYRALAKAEVCAMITKLELENLKNPNPDLARIDHVRSDVSTATLGLPSGSSS